MKTTIKSNQNETKISPFLKWAGGKGQLLKQFEKFFPEKFNNYCEPFIGGGAVFFHLYNTGRITRNKKATLIDSNEELINCYLVIKKDVNKLIRVLKNKKYVNEHDTFYRIRAEEPKDKIRRAARTIYLNKTCYNGLYRVNSKGKFNAPFGRYKNPQILNEKNLRAVSKALKNVSIKQGSFEKCLNDAKKGDFVYFDPPYHPLSQTSNFTSYTKESFGKEKQTHLSEVFKKLDKKGCKVMLSNSNTKFIKDLYRGVDIETVKAKRAINCRATGRGIIYELLIKNKY